MNRFVTTRGMLTGGAIVRGTTGVDIGYDLAGQRISAKSILPDGTPRAPVCAGAKHALPGNNLIADHPAWCHSRSPIPAAKSRPAKVEKSVQAQQSDTASRLQRLSGYLERDPENPGLLADAASAAFAEKEFGRAEELLDRLERLAPPLPPELLNLRGLAAIHERRFDDAVVAFGALRTAGQGDPAIAFNLAWSHAMLNQFESALDLLDDEVVAVSPRAPALKIQMLQHLDRYDEALAVGEALAERFPDNGPLMGALATLAMDAGKADLARDYAARAGDDPEALAARGVLALETEDLAGAEAMLDQSIAARANNPRAWVGKGLARLAAGDAAAGAAAIDHGAEQFGDHIGSWIASGWAHFVAGNLDQARTSFDRALAIDPNFGETHGALAVLDLLGGDAVSARRRTDTALRLDRTAFGGILAKTMLLDAAGDAQAAQALRERALNTPIGSDGRTIAQALAGMSLRSGR
jgi:Flp pilus assembly protein TadD